MARIENLPSDIKNGQGLAATQVVGWLPVISQLSDDLAKHGKLDYVNFKKAVYHACMKHLLLTIAQESNIGDIFNCGGTKQLLYPFIFLLAADFKEICQNAFWSVHFSYPHAAAAFDELHKNCHGVSGKHLFKEAKCLINEMSAPDHCKVAATIGKHYLFVFASHNVLAIHKDSLGYKLLVAFRKYVNMTLEVHTSTTITAGHKAVEEFGIAINAYDKALSHLPDSNSNSDPGSDDEDDPLLQKYNFPKLHNQTHAFGDVENKGVLCCFSTQLFEGHHKSLKHWYQTKTNFKDIASQVRFTF
ncbi:hypothetical protein C0989_002474 [Termitomyces sp. Mn162]|nr:hypothetical protein C0989_002474 [Termitomyces sp. Mn162]